MIAHIPDSFEKLLIITLFVFTTGFDTFGGSNWVEISSATPVPAQINLIQSNIQVSTVEFTLIGFSLNEFSIQNQSYHNIRVEDAIPLLVEGHPDLVSLSTSVIIPDKAGMVVKVTATDYIDYENINIIPSKGSIDRNTNPNDKEIAFSNVYQTDDFYPGKLTETETPYILRDVRAQTITIFPFQYNPVTKILRVYYSMTIELVVANENGENPLERPSALQNSSLEFNRIYSRQFLNATEIEESLRYTPVAEAGNMLIIAYGTYKEAMSPFIEWKIQKGIATEMIDVSEIGDATAIKEFVKNYYTQKGVTYLLLVGDAEQVPTYQAANGASDVSYGYVAGNDHYPDLLVGRFSAESVDQVMLQVNKSINYEKNPLQNNDWLTTNIGIASDLGPGDDNELDFEHVRNMQNDLLNCTYKNTYELFDGNQGNNDANGNPSKAMVIENINTGAGSILYTGMGNFTKMGTSNFSVYETDKLTNWDMHPFIIAAGCNLGDFVNKTCLAESLMRASHNSKPTGTVAALMSSAVQSWFPPMKAQDAMVDILVESSNGNVKRTFGGIAMNGCMAMNDKYGMGAYPVTDTWNIFGDPSLEIRTDNPSIMEASHNDVISVESYGITIYANANNGFVSITSGNKILGQATISNGQAEVLFDQVLVTGSMTVVITAFNYIPYFGEITVIAHPTSTQGPVPANHMNMVSPYSSLHWEKGIGGTPDYYKVYLGTDNPPTNMINGVITSGTSIIPEAILDYNQTYYWKVDAINNHGEAEGDIWEFTAIRPPDETFENSNPSDFGFGSRSFWTFEGDAPWEIDNNISFNGSYSLKSGTIQNQQYSSISFESYNTHNDFVAFGHKVSSEEGKDKLQFLIDGHIMGEWSGEIDWTQESYPVPSGSHKLEWKYIKDEMNYGGGDCVWIDDIYLPLNEQIMVMAGQDEAICEGNNYVVSGFAQHYSVVRWSTSGTGRFTDKSVVSPLYVPSPEDIDGGEVILAIFAENAYSGTCTMDEMTLRFKPLPEINILTDTIITPGENIYLDVYASDIVNYLWLPDGQTTSGMDFYSSDYELGTHTLKVYVVSSNGCVNHKFINITIENEVNEVNNNLSLTVYPNPSNGEVYYDLNATHNDQVRHMVFNQSGALVYESEKIDIDNNYSGAIDLTNLPPGIYFMNTTGTEASTSEKIIIQ